MSLFKSAFTVGGFTLCSRILGYTRDILIAFTLGASGVADAFFVAFRLPNFFRTLSAEGAFNAAFVPLFSGKLTEDGQAKAVSFAEYVMSLMFVILLVLTIIMQIFMPAIMHVLAPGFLEDGEKFELAVHFGRIVFPYLLFVSLVSLFSGILNSLGKFAAAASAPIWLNILAIFTLLFLVEYTETPAHALSWAVVLSGLVQLIWVVLAAYRAGVVLRIRIPKVNNDVKKLLRRMVPGVIGGGVTQINLWVNTVIATTMSGAVSYLYYADRLVQFPLAIIGTAMGTALLPMLSKQIKNKQLGDAIKTQNNALELVLLFTIPAAVAFMVLSELLIAVMFERGAFDAEATNATARALVAYACGLPAFVMIKIFAPCFFANGDTKTPLKVAVVCLVMNVLLSLTLIRWFDHVGLAMATSVAAWLNTVLLGWFLIKHGLYCVDVGLCLRLVRIVVASVVMGYCVWLLYQFVAHYLVSGLIYQVVCVGSLIVVGVVVFFVVAHIIGGCKINRLKVLLNL